MAKLRIDGYEIDVEALYSVEHKCDPNLCGIEDSCCRKYEIVIEPEEVEKLVGMLPAAVKFAKNLKDGDDYENVFEALDDKLVRLDSTENGLCLFAYKKTGAAFCSLHSAGLKTGLSPIQVKPEVCCLWPLALDGPKNKRLSVQDDALMFICNRVRRPGAKKLSRDIAETIDMLFGVEFRKKIEAFRKKMLSPATGA